MQPYWMGAFGLFLDPTKVALLYLAFWLLCILVKREKKEKQSAMSYSHLLVLFTDGLVRRFMRDEGGVHFDHPSPLYDQKDFVPIEVKAGSLVVIHGDLIHQRLVSKNPLQERVAVSLLCVISIYLIWQQFWESVFKIKACLQLARSWYCRLQMGTRQLVSKLRYWSFHMFYIFVVY